MSKHPVLKDHPTLEDIQTYIADAALYRGFDQESLRDTFILLTEEVGELAKALRKHTGVKLATDSKIVEVENEAADVLWMLICICNQLGINLEKALRAKEEANKTRIWQ